MNRQDQLADLAGRAALCRLLAEFYRQEVTSQLVETLEKDGLLSHLEANGYKISRERLTSDADFLQELREEFCRIFIGPGKHLVPYGSVHHPDDDKRGELWGETTKKVFRIAKDHGLEFDGKKYDGIADHIGHELELYARLIAAEHEALQSDKEEVAERMVNSQWAVLSQHLLRWVPGFCGKVRDMSQVDFYKEVARLTIEFLTEEDERLSPKMSERAPAADSAPPADS